MREQRRRDVTQHGPQLEENACVGASRIADLPGGPWDGRLAVGSFVAAMAGSVAVGSSSIWVAIAFAVLALAMQAYRHARKQPTIGWKKLLIAVGALASAAIGAVLVIVDRAWLSIPLAALALGIDAAIRARQRAKLGRSRGIRIAVGALASAAIGAGVALLGFAFALALSLLPFVVANHRARKRHPKAVARRIILIATLDRVTLAVVAIVVVLVAFRTDVAAIKFPDLKQLQVDDDLKVGSCIARPPIDPDAPARVVSCHAPAAYGRVVKTPPLSFLEPACPARTDDIVQIRGLGAPKACVVALAAPHPGAAGAGGGVIRRGDCIARPARVTKHSTPGVVTGPVLHEVPCAAPGAFAHVVARVDRPERCPSATRALFLEATDRPWVCIAHS
jgi:hypothetical protein